MQRRNAQNSTKNRYINGVPKTTAQRQTSIKSTPAKQTFIAKTKNKTEYSKRYNKNIKNIKTLEEILQEINNHSLPSKTPYHTSPFLRHRLGPGMNWWSCEADCAAPFAQTISPWRLKALASLLVRWWVGKQDVARNLDIFFYQHVNDLCLHLLDVPIQCLKLYLDRIGLLLQRQTNMPGAGIASMFPGRDPCCWRGANAEDRVRKSLTTLPFGLFALGVHGLLRVFASSSISIF